MLLFDSDGDTLLERGREVLGLRPHDVARSRPAPPRELDRNPACPEQSLVNFDGDEGLGEEWAWKRWKT